MGEPKKAVADSNKSMSRSFEDDFTLIQTDMVEICEEYADYKADIVYVYASYEDDTISCDYFYRVGSCLVERHKLNDISGSVFDTSVERQREYMGGLVEDIQKLIMLCKEYNKKLALYELSKKRHDSFENERKYIYEHVVACCNAHLNKPNREQRIKILSIVAVLCWIVTIASSVYVLYNAHNSMDGTIHGFNGEMLYGIDAFIDTILM